MGTDRAPRMEAENRSLAQGVDNHPVFGIWARQFLPSRPVVCFVSATLVRVVVRSPLRLKNGVSCVLGVDSRTLDTAAACGRLSGVSSCSSSSCYSSGSSPPSTAASAAHPLSWRASTFFLHALGASLVDGLPALLRCFFDGYPLAPLSPRGNRWFCDSTATLSRLRHTCIVSRG